MWRFLVASVGPVNAEDCFQETFVAALRAYPRLRDGSNLRAWVLTIAHRKALDVASRACATRLPIAEMRRAVADGDGRGCIARRAGPRRGAVERRPRAPERQRSAVVLRFLGDLPHRDIAVAIGCSEEAARRSLHEGLPN